MANCSTEDMQSKTLFLSALIQKYVSSCSTVDSLNKRNWSNLWIESKMRCMFTRKYLIFTKGFLMTHTQWESCAVLLRHSQVLSTEGLIWRTQFKENCLQLNSLLKCLFLLPFLSGLVQAFLLCNLKGIWVMWRTFWIWCLLTQWTLSLGSLKFW